MNLLPPPALLGLPPKFDSWRRGQDKAVLQALDSKQRAFLNCAPTGFGKTVCYVAQALLGGKRTAILTATKALETQLVDDFTSCGLVDIRGKQNYTCRALLRGGEHEGQGITAGTGCDAGPCNVGAYCSLRNGGCGYYDQVRLAQKADLIVTNYSYWILSHIWSEGLGDFDLLVLDEAHEAADALTQALEVEISDFECRTVTGRAIPRGEDSNDWKAWAQVTLRALRARDARLGEEIEAGESAAFRERQRVRRLTSKVVTIATMEGPWVIERTAKGAKLTPVWVAPYAEKCLFLDIPRLLFVSATIRAKTLDMLGVKTFDSEEQPSSFPLDRRPVIYIPTVQVRHTWTEMEQRSWVNRIDQIIDQRLDRKGVIHTVSYERRDLVLELSRHRDIMLANDSRDTEATVARFRRMPPPAVLVSPSMTTGWDLPAEDCEYAIIAKIPFPDSRSRIIQTRQTDDVDYGPYVAMQTIVQASGRGMRSAEDQCEVLVIDDQWKWFWPKYKHFAPRWFAAAVRYVHTIPSPLPKLKTKEKHHVPR